MCLESFGKTSRLQKEALEWHLDEKSWMFNAGGHEVWKRKELTGCNCALSIRVVNFFA